MLHIKNMPGNKLKSKSFDMERDKMPEDIRLLGFGLLFAKLVSP